MAALPSLAELNARPASGFAAALAPLFEAPAEAPFLALLAARRPFPSDTALFDAAREVVAALPETEKRALLDGHVEVGAPREAVRARSAYSYREQRYDIDAPTDDPEARAREELARLNAEYRARFGFTFVVFVKGRPPSAMVPILRERITRTPQDELRTAILELVAIAEDRARGLRRVGC